MKTIFVVDDNIVNLAAAKKILADNGYRTFTLHSVDKMFALFSKVTPDLILLDIEMPEMDGFAAIEKLKADEHTANIPVMFLTASTEPKAEAKSLEAGAVDFVLKPFSASDLIKRIERII